MSIFNPRTRWIRVILTVVNGALISHTVVGNVRKPVAQTKAPTTVEAISQQVRKLETGKKIERALRGGESHIYEIEIHAGQYLNAVIEQRGIDVVVRVIAPDGKHLVEIDSPNGDQGPEHE